MLYQEQSASRWAFVVPFAALLLGVATILINIHP